MVVISQQILDDEKSGYQKNREYRGENVEIFIDKRLNARAENVNKPTDKKKTCGSRHQRCQDKYGKVNLKGAGGDGKDLVGYRRKTRYTDGPCIVSIIKNFNICNLLSEAVKIDDASADGRHELPSDKISETSPENGSCGTDQCIFQGFFGNGNSQCDEKDIRRNGEKRGFAESQNKQCP